MGCKHYQSMLFSARAQPIKAAQSVLEGVAALDSWRTLEYFRLLRCRLQINPSKTLRWQKCLACDVCSTTLVQLRIAKYLRRDLEQQLAAGAANNVPGYLLVDIPIVYVLAHALEENHPPTSAISSFRISGTAWKGRYPLGSLSAFAWSCTSVHVISAERIGILPTWPSSDVP